MSIVGRALAQLARRSGGQFLIELPDDLPARFMVALLKGANEEVDSTPPFALFAHNNRTDVANVSPSVDYRELAMYRQGSHLAVTYASDNRGMHTYTSVYQPLLGAAFPANSDQSSGAGVARMEDFVRAMASVLSANGPATDLDEKELFEVVDSICNFLATAYQIAGKGQLSLAADWWWHMERWTDALCAKGAARSEPLVVADIYACAGLPGPRKGLRLEMKPSDYVSVLTERWSDHEAIQRELDRLTSVTSASAAASHLKTIDWEAAQLRASLRSDSLVARVAAASIEVSSSLDAAFDGWRLLSEQDFKDSYTVANGRLAVRMNGDDLPRPWSTSMSVLVASPQQYAEAGKYSFEEIEVLLPWKSGIDPPESLPVGFDKVREGVVIQGLRGAAVSFELATAEPVRSGLLLSGRMNVTPSSKTPNVLGLEAVVTGQLAALVADRADTSVCLVGPKEIALQIRGKSKRARGVPKTPFIWSLGQDSPTAIALALSGTYEVALACGAETGATEANTTFGLGKPFERWPALDRADLLQITSEVLDDVDIKVGDVSRYEINFSVEQTARILSPIVAAAHGVSPAVDIAIERTVLGDLEREMIDMLAAHESGDVLGALLLVASQDSGVIESREHKLRCDKKAAALLGNLTPGEPTSELLDHPSYAALADAYKELDLVERIGQLEAEAKIRGLNVSRMSLIDISAEHISALLVAYQGVIDASVGMSPSNRFWAKHPFTVVTYPDGIGAQSASALLLSPLHPIRLGWLWEVQVGLRAANDDGADPASCLSLVDNSQFPTVGFGFNSFGNSISYLPVPIDSFPSDVYLGWHAMVPIVNEQLVVPDWIRGKLFPVDGLSALSSAAVTSAINDFLRASPQVQSLQIRLESLKQTRRSVAIDDGVLNKIQSLALSSGGLDGIGGIRIVDSIRRQGPIPSFDRIRNSLSFARAGFNASWSSDAAAGKEPPHITFVEGTAAQIHYGQSSKPMEGWLPAVPLRRFPRRIRASVGAELNFSLTTAPAGASPLWSSLRCYESASSQQAYSLQVQPNIGVIADRPNWLVTGDFGVDPQSVSAAAHAQTQGSYMLWDWRPVTTVNAGRGFASVRSQPYFVLAAVPETLNNAIVERMRKLNSKIDDAEVRRRTGHLVSTLAARAVGLNTLLAIGHHQATGAFGFFFALSSLSQWMAESEADEARLVIPVDAVDPFLRAMQSAKEIPTSKRADLLLVYAKMRAGLPPLIVLVPIEIKHYGLGGAGEIKSFPDSADAGFQKHIAQLGAYREQLAGLCSLHSESTGSRRSILGIQLSAVLDAAFQLATTSNDSLPNELLRNVSGGDAKFVVGEGLLVWYQAGGRGPGKEPVTCEELAVGGKDARVELKIDPTEFDEAFWKSSAGSEVHKIFRQGIGLAIGGALGSEDESVTSTFPEDDGGGAGSNQNPDSGVAPKESPAEPALPIGQDGPGLAVSELKQRKRISAPELEARYKRVLAALDEFHVKVQRTVGVDPSREGPAFVEFAVTPAYGVSVSKIVSQLENLKLRLKLPSDAVIGASTHLGNVVLSVPKLDAERYFISTDDIWPRWKRPEKGFHIPLGEDISGEIVAVELSNPNSPHLLMGGGTGSGKSEALLTLLHGAIHFYSPDELKLRLVDPKQTELNSLQFVLHNDHEIGFTAEDAILLLEGAVEEMDARYVGFRQAGARDIDEYCTKATRIPRWLIVLDEYSDLTSDDADRKKIEKLLKRLSQKARAAGIHVIVCTQKPVVQVVNTVVRGNLPGRIALRVNSNAESRVILDEGGAEELVGKGDALLKVGNTKVRLQFARHELG